MYTCKLMLQYHIEKYQYWSILVNIVSISYRSENPTGLQLGNDYIDVDAEIDCGDQLTLT